MHRHPGSPETLMDNAGADATELFEDIGHSSLARDLMKSLESVGPTSIKPADARGPCSGRGHVLWSTAQRLRQQKIVATRGADAVKALASRGQNFFCETCEGTFEPADADRERDSTERRRVCSHSNGTLRVFYSPLREEWGCFYSCCRKHFLLSGR